MLFKEFYTILTERTLYHGTSADHEKDIKELGLIPMVGDWVKDSYGLEYDFSDDSQFVNDDRFDNADDYYSIVFAGDKSGILKALGGIRYHIGKKLGKDINAVSWDEIKRYGMLVIINDDDSDPSFIKHPENSWKNRDYENEHRPPPSVEPGDMWTRSHIGPRNIRAILTGEALIKYLNKFGVIRQWGDNDKDTIKAMRTNLIRMVKKHHPDKDISDIVSKVNNMSKDDLIKWHDKYQSYVGEVDKLDESKNKPILISVDIQPEYYHKAVKYGGFDDDLLQGFVNELNSNKYGKKIIFYNGADTLGMISENDYKMWLYENGVEEDRLDSLKFYDKGYAFFRFLMDTGVDEDDIVLMVKWMYENGINDSRDIKESGLWDKFISEYNKVELREILEDSSACINIPDLMEDLKVLHGEKIILIGGGANECLKEVEIALQALGIKYNKLDNLIYERTDLRF